MWVGPRPSQDPAGPLYSQRRAPAPSASRMLLSYAPSKAHSTRPLRGLPFQLPHCSLQTSVQNWHLSPGFPTQDCPLTPTPEALRVEQARGFRVNQLGPLYGWERWETWGAACRRGEARAGKEEAAGKGRGGREEVSPAGNLARESPPWPGSSANGAVTCLLGTCFSLLPPSVQPTPHDPSSAWGCTARRGPLTPFSREGAGHSRWQCEQGRDTTSLTGEAEAGLAGALLQGPGLWPGCRPHEPLPE